MRKLIVSIPMILGCILSGCNNVKCDDEKCQKSGSESATYSDNSLIKPDSTSQMMCKLTSKELQERKETVLASLKSQITEKKELANGYAFKFPGDDKTIDELTAFIKSERS